MSAEERVRSLMQQLADSVNAAKAERRSGGEDAIRREVEACIEEEEAKAAFRAKLREMRETGSIPGYVGPRATRDK